MYEGIPHSTSSDGSSEPVQEHELDGQWKVFLLIGVAGMLLGLSFFTGPLCWIRGRRLRKGYDSLSLPVPNGAAGVETLGMLSTVLSLLAIPFALIYMH